MLNVTSRLNYSAKVCKKITFDKTDIELASTWRNTLSCNKNNVAFALAYVFWNVYVLQLMIKHFDVLLLFSNALIMWNTCNPTVSYLILSHDKKRRKAFRLVYKAIHRF